MSCCTEITSLGCFNSCELIDTGIAADGNNISVEWEWLGVANSVLVATTSGDDITVPAFIFNERSTPVFKIYNTGTSAYETLDSVECLSARITPNNGSADLGYDGTITLGSAIVVDELTGTGSVTSTQDIVQLIGVWRNGQLIDSDNYTRAGNVVTFDVTATIPALDPSESVTLVYIKNA